MAEIQVVGGDIEPGVWQLHGDATNAIMDNPRKKRLDLSSELLSVEELTEDNRPSIGRIATSAVVGALLAGPIGALGGALLFGRHKTVNFVATLKNTQQFVGNVEKSLFPTLVACAIKSRSKAGGFGGKNTISLSGTSLPQQHESDRRTASDKLNAADCSTSDSRSQTAPTMSQVPVNERLDGEKLATCPKCSTGFTVREHLQCLTCPKCKYRYFPPAPPVRQKRGRGRGRR